MNSVIFLAMMLTNGGHSVDIRMWITDKESDVLEAVLGGMRVSMLGYVHNGTPYRVILATPTIQDEVVLKALIDTSLSDFLSDNIVEVGGCAIDPDEREDWIGGDD